MQIKKKGQEGFTLIELLVVVVIIGILSSVAVPNFMGAQDKAKNSGVQSNGHNVQMAIEQYAVDYAGIYPDTLAAVVGATSSYLVAYPKTPWNTQQAAAQVIEAAAGELNAVVGAGTMAAPTTNNQYGAIGFTDSGTANEKYDLTGVGKKGGNAIVTFKVKNY
ncbi:Type II secretion system protein G precursor [compost metagenome]